MLNNLLFSPTACAMVLLGTLYPLLADALDAGQDLGRAAVFRADVRSLLMAPVVLLLPFGSADHGLAARRRYARPLRDAAAVGADWRWSPAASRRTSRRRNGPWKTAAGVVRCGLDRTAGTAALRLVSGVRNARAGNSGTRLTAEMLRHGAGARRPRGVPDRRAAGGSADCQQREIAIEAGTNGWTLGRDSVPLRWRAASAVGPNYDRQPWAPWSVFDGDDRTRDHAASRKTPNTPAAAR